MLAGRLMLAGLHAAPVCPRSLYQLAVTHTVFAVVDCSKLMSNFVLVMRPSNFHLRFSEEIRDLEHFQRACIV